jgi:hypothetical protein
MSLGTVLKDLGDMHTHEGALVWRESLKPCCGQCVPEVHGERGGRVRTQAWEDVIEGRVWGSGQASQDR